MNNDQATHAKEMQDSRDRHAEYMAKLDAEYQDFAKRIGLAHEKLDALGAPRIPVSQ